MKRIFISTIAAVLACCAALADEPNQDTIYAPFNGRIACLKGKAFVAQGKCVYLCSKEETTPQCRLSCVEIEARNMQDDGKLSEAYEVVRVPVKFSKETWSPGDAAYVSFTEVGGRLNIVLTHNGGDIYIIPDSDGTVAPEITIHNMPENMELKQCSAVAYDGKILVLLEHRETHKSYFAKLNVHTGMLEEELYPGGNPYAYSLIWRGDDTVWQISVGHKAMSYAAYSLSKKGYVLEDGWYQSRYITLVGNALYDMYDEKNPKLIAKLPQE